MTPTAARSRPGPWVGRLGVPLSQVALAASGYVALVACGRSLTAAGFAAVTAFYLLMNTLGRGTFAAVELELTRRVSAARAAGTGVDATYAAGLRGALVMLLVAIAVLAVAGPFLVPALGGVGTVVVLGAASATLAAAYGVRGPLAAAGRYSRYSATFTVEAAAALAGTAGLALAGVTEVWAWAAVLAASPALGALVAAGRVGGHRLRRIACSLRRPGASTGLADLSWSALLFVASQGVWNLGPVIVTARWGAQPDSVAGFVAAVVLLRAPVMLFPAVQALVLPSLVRDGRTGGLPALRPAARWAVATGAVGWLAGGVLLTPLIVRLLFATGPAPSAAVLAALSVSVLLGAAAQFCQAALLARRRHRAVATTWTVGLLLLVGVALLPGRPDLAAVTGQVLATAFVLVALLRTTRREGHRA